VGDSDGERGVGVRLAAAAVVDVGTGGVAVAEATEGCGAGVTEWVRVGKAAGSASVGRGAVGSLAQPAHRRIRTANKRVDPTLKLLMVTFFPFHCVETTASPARRFDQDSRDQSRDA
jgi:hypothetical protein